MKHTYICKRCGKVFLYNHKKAICNDCETKIIQEIKHPIFGICPVCGKAYTPRRRCQKFCSKRCQIIAGRVRINVYHRDHTQKTHKEREREKRKDMTFAARLEAYGRHMGYRQGYGMAAAKLREECKKTGRSAERQLEIMEEEMEGED